MSKYNKEELENLILVQNLSYEAIGRLYGVTGNAIKKAAARLEINLPSRRKINPCETFNKDTSKAIRHCLNCGKESGNVSRCGISNHIRRYLFEKYNSKCQRCDWGEVNSFTKLVPLQVHHIDGNCTNNNEDNLQLLCPNCHSLTDTYGSLNANSSRTYRRQK